MPRLTIALDEKDHLALKLLSLRENRRLNEVIDDAIKFYLSSTGGYGLRISDAGTDLPDSAKTSDGE
ncbi:MAG: hypothetical protein KXJ50_09530 [Vulcanococcus sp.]|jgi:hypothetical protein|uniref:hypothetical protein n=1 Tax=Vulcanococcus sp. TaxID=2856995 RepID=UPI0025E45136|nr:hypothetical protein [Vulcanococcus sp.]MBW0175005.1 hypothetical protein [Vulcanococcus sp.]MBW0181294.1 hypothetical protein [Vulcanococcus sp.]